MYDVVLAAGVMYMHGALLLLAVVVGGQGGAGGAEATNEGVGTAMLATLAEQNKGGVRQIQVRRRLVSCSFLRQ